MIFVAWIGHSRRSQLIAEKFRLELHLVQVLKRRRLLIPLRYILQTVVTIALLIREKPKLVFVQNPPIFAVLIVYLYAKLAGAKYVIDSHTGALLHPMWQWSLPLHGFLSRQAITTIVTNEHLASMIKSWGGQTTIIADIPTTFPPGKPFPTNGRFNVAVINTFSPDEPLNEILDAANSLPDVQFYITGDLVRAKKTYLKNQADNVKFTGFLPDEEYLGLLRAAQAIMVLTTDDHTMQRGACEAVWLGKPIITSDWPLLKSYFYKGTIHVDNSSQGIQEGIRRMEQQVEFLEKEVLLLQKDRRLEWEEKYVELARLIEEHLAS